MAGLEWAKPSSSYNQYEEYRNLPKLLKRFSLEEKMRIACKYSAKVTSLDQVRKPEDMQNTALPWCLETFVMLSLEAKEYTDGNFLGRNENRFRTMLNSIWNANSFLLNESCADFSFADVFFPLTMMTQVPIQESYLIKLYRYRYVFTDHSSPVDLGSVFEEKFGVPYQDFLLLAETLYSFFAIQESSDIVIPDKVLDYLILKRFPKATQSLLVSRDEYVRLQRKYVDGSEDPYKYVYSIRPSYQYAFVSEGNVFYFPLPHLIIQNVTSSLMYRITEGNNQLRTDIGKHIWEKYVCEIIEESGVYDEVYPEQSYVFSGSKSLSPDVLTRQGKHILFLDSKSTVPSIGIRILKEYAIKRHIEAVAENIAKMYNQINRFKYYNPFKGEVSSDRNDYWGVVVVLEDSFISRDFYYKKAREMVKEKMSDVEFEWMRAHIKVASLYDIEHISLTGQSIIDVCREAAEDQGTSYSFPRILAKKTTMKSVKYLEFIESLKHDFAELIYELKREGCFK